jgi:hypothetical protein
VPLLALMAAGLPRAALRWGALVCVPVAVAHGAAVFLGGQTWDARRRPEHAPEAVWDLRDSPFSDLAWGAPRPEPALLAPRHYRMLPATYPARQGQDLPWLVYGWEAPEPEGVWASGAESWIALAAPPGRYILVLYASAPRDGARPQRIRVERPGAPPLELELARGLWEFEHLLIPFEAQRALTLLKLFPSHTWLPGRGDVRRCSLFVASIRLHREPGSS